MISQRRNTNTLTLTVEDMVGLTDEKEVLKNTRGRRYDVLRIPKVWEPTWKDNEIFRRIEQCISIGTRMFAKVEFY